MADTGASVGANLKGVLPNVITNKFNSNKANSEAAAAETQGPGSGKGGLGSGKGVPLNIKHSRENKSEQSIKSLEDSQLEADWV